MSIIRNTNSDCSIKKIEYIGAKAIVHLKIVAFAKTEPVQGVMIGIKTSKEPFIPAFKATSEDDTYQNKIFWINYSSSIEHTNQNIGMEAIIPVPIDLSKGTYKNNRLYREVTILISDYQNEEDILWSSQPLHLCSELLNFNITGTITPTFTAYNDADGTEKYKLSLAYKFSENSWLFDIKHPDLTLTMSVDAHQSVKFNTCETILPDISGSWDNITAELEPDAHVTIITELKLNDTTLWKDCLTCVPNELTTIYIKNNNSIYLVTHKAAIYRNLIRDAHLYHDLGDAGEVILQIVPWLKPDNTHRKGQSGSILYTIDTYVKDIYGKLIPLKNFFTLPLLIQRVFSNQGDNLHIPNNLTGDIYEDFPTIIYNNYGTDVAEHILSTMLLAEGVGLEISIQGLTAIKHPVLLAGDNILIGNLAVREG